MKAGWLNTLASRNPNQRGLLEIASPWSLETGTPCGKPADIYLARQKGQSFGSATLQQVARCYRPGDVKGTACSKAL